MFATNGLTDDFVRLRIDDLLNEAENDRMAARAAGPGRPWRVRVAGWLKATAQWVEGQPQGSIARAEA